MQAVVVIVVRVVLFYACVIGGQVTVGHRAAKA